MINYTRKNIYFPDDWAKCALSPFYKGKGDKWNPINWRPIGPGSNIGKILERMWYDEIMDDLQARNWLNKMQHCFRPHEGAEEALIIMVKLIRYILKYGKDAQRNKIKGLHVLLFDFEKAFDKAWNQGLLFEMRKSGIFGITYEQIRLFLPMC